MRKFINLAFFVAISFICASLVACNNSTDYSKYLSSLRQNVYRGENQDFIINAEYGFSKINDEKVYSLTFSLEKYPVKEALYSLVFIYDEIDYSNDFAINSVSGVHSLNIPIKNFNENSFELKIKHGSTLHDITMLSLLPENTLNYKVALEKLWEFQPELMQGCFNDNGEFVATLSQRIVVKNNKPYYYIGIEKNGKLKAFLLDGFTATPLAEREVVF